MMSRGSSNPVHPLPRRAVIGKLLAAFVKVCKGSLGKPNPPERLLLICPRLNVIREQHAVRGVQRTHLNMEAQPAPDQMEWTTTGYTQAAMKKEYRAYASTRARSAMAPDTMVHAVAANCA